jgi:hypothetical protein
MKFQHLCVIALLGLTAQLAHGHSWVACTDYKITPGSGSAGENYYDASLCKAWPRNWKSVATNFGVDMGYNYQYTETQACRDPLSTDTSTFGYPSNFPMATYSPGQQVCLAWPSKNHVAATCTNQYIPDTELKIYATKTGTSDPVENGFKQKTVADLGGHVNGVIDFKGFQHCPKFCENMDKSLCTQCFTIPQNMESGVWTFQWWWIFNAGSPAYTTCWEARVGGSGSSGVVNTTTTGKATTTAATATTAATTAAATSAATVASATSTSSTTGTGSTTGSTPATGCETLIIVSAPTTISQTSSFNVTLAYVAQANRDIIVDLMGGNNWYGKGVVTVPAGKGSATLTVVPQGNPQMGNNYSLHAWDVAQGQASVNGAWNSAYDNDYKTLTVGNSVTY